ncbi:MAG: TIGR01777 family protein [Bacteroidetes bacterium]|nr:TIGR01777 family protein [Bacteroidota bacterium]
MKKLIIAGGTGFLGQALIRHFEKDYDKIVILSRHENKVEGKTVYLKWDARTFGTWCLELEGATAVINLCGKSVDCRYTEENKKLIFSSRLDSTKIIGEAILKCSTPPLLWINGASATIYRNSEDKPMGETTGEIGKGFSVEVCKAWEKVFNDFTLPKTRKANLRISLVFGSSRGVLPVMMKVVKKGIGGAMGNGQQQVSWIHVDDFCSIIRWMIDNTNATGPYNIVAPEPVRNKKLMAMLRKKAGIAIGLPSPKWLLEIGAFFIRTETELILKSRYVVPERLLNEGFQFKYNTIEECLESLKL